MDKITHELYDKRLMKPVVYRISETNEDVTLKQILTLKLGKCEVRFDAPNFISLFLEKSKRELDSANDIYESLIKPKLTTIDRFELSDTENITLFDYFEHVMSAITNGYTAVESLVNDLIPDDYIYEVKVKGVTQKLIRKDILRRISTVDKLTEIIPHALKIQNPKSYVFWNKFKDLQTLRNNVIHFRSMKPIEQIETKRVISQLINDSIFGKVRSAYELINKIQTELPSNAKMPMIMDIETINPINVPSWEATGFIHED